jgi:hypothetical protein
MKKIQFIVLNAIVLSMVVFSDVKAQSAVNDTEGARIFAQKYYDWYNKLVSGFDKNKSTPFSIAITKRAKYFDTTLLKAIMRNIHVQSMPLRTAFFPVSPITDIDGSDTDDLDPDKTYRIGKAEHYYDDIFRVCVYAVKKGKSFKVPMNSGYAFAVSVKKEQRHWVIADFCTPRPDGHSCLLYGLTTLDDDLEKRHN